MNQFSSLAVVLGFFLAYPVSFACDLTYEVRSEETSSPLCIVIERIAEGTTYHSSYQSVRQAYRYGPAHELLLWEYRDDDEGTRIEAERTGETITIRGKLRGQPADETLQVGREIWLQNSEFGLLEFLRSQKKSIEFFVITPGDLSVTRLRAYRQDEAEIDWNGRAVGAAVVKARLTGFLSPFWQATYWYRLPEMTFLRYKAQGLPGIPKADIQLTEIRSSHLGAGPQSPR